MEKTINKITSVLILSLIIGCTSINKEVKTQQNKLGGAWEIIKTNWVSNDTVITITPKKPGSLLITPNRYSIIWVPVQNRTPFKILSNPTIDETVMGFRTIVFNSGIYSSTDSTFTTTALLAKVPGFEGGKQFYNFQKQNDTIMRLTMYDETYPNKTKPSWAGKWKTEFYLKRIEK
jgi:hypothetical protein